MLLCFDSYHAVRRPQDLLAAILRVPFVDLVTTMTRSELPLTVHEYGEWGDPSDPAVLDQVRLWLLLMPNVKIPHIIIFCRDTPCCSCCKDFNVWWFVTQ